jgi:RNA polymerase sigma-70 factor, ECF subfamily
VCSVLGPYREADAEDATQDAFLRCYRRLHTFRGDSAFSSWLYRIAYNCALDHRAKARFIPVETDHAVHTDPDRPIDLARAMEGLPDLYRTTIYLYYWQDCSLAEISQYTGVGEGTLKSWLARAREQLRKKLK